MAYFDRYDIAEAHCAVNSPEDGTTFPYDFEAYVKCAAKCNERRLQRHWG